MERPAMHIYRGLPVYAALVRCGHVLDDEFRHVLELRGRQVPSEHWRHELRQLRPGNLAGEHRRLCLRALCRRPLCHND